MYLRVRISRRCLQYVRYELPVCDKLANWGEMVILIPEMDKSPEMGKSSSNIHVNATSVMQS